MNNDTAINNIGYLKYMEEKRNENECGNDNEMSKGVCRESEPRKENFEE